MKTITATWLKTHCAAVMEEVRAKCICVVITKRGKAVAKLVPMKRNADDIFGFLKGKGEIIGDIILPLQKGERIPGSMKGRLRVGRKFFAPLPSSELSRWE